MKLFVNKVFGIAKLSFSVIWLILGIFGLIFGLKGIRSGGAAVNQNFTVLIENIDLVNALLEEMIDVVDMVDQSMATVERSMINAGLSLDETRPVINKTSQVIIQDVPDALDEVQATMPSVIEAAAMIDHTLNILSRFRFGIPIPFGSDLEISLGVDYNPPVPLEESLINLRGNLEGIPESLRAMEGDLINTDENLVIMSDNLIDVARDLDLVREQIADINPEIKKMVTNIKEAQDTISDFQVRIPNIIKRINEIFWSIMLIFIASQIPSIYVGYFMTGEGFSNSRLLKDPKDGEKNGEL